MLWLSREVGVSWGKWNWHIYVFYGTSVALNEQRQREQLLNLGSHKMSFTWKTTDKPFMVKMSMEVYVTSRQLCDFFLYIAFLH